MYIWIACDLSNSLANVRETCTVYNKSLGLSEVAFSLPQHISLKISFEVQDSISQEVINTVSDYLSAVKGFEIEGPVPELYGGILWLRFPEDNVLAKLHSDLDSLLMGRYGIEQHIFDRDFKFHSTLFIDENIQKLQNMYDKVCLLNLPKRVPVYSFIIGISASGKAGEYSVHKIIRAKM